MASGLNALTQAVADLTAAVSSATAEISTLVTELAANGDPKVQAAADQIEALVSNLNAAVAAATPPAAG